MRIQKISGDGNCLFHSCGYLLSLCHCQVRKKVIHTFKYHSDMIINGQTLTWWIQVGGYGPNYISEMEKNRTWGDGLCLSVISLVYQRCIRIFEKDFTGFKRIAEYFPEFPESLNLLYDGIHYDVLVPE